MNILFITPSLPSRLNRYRAFCLIKNLAKHHKVHLLCLSTSAQKNQLSGFQELLPLLASYKTLYTSTLRSIMNCVLGFFSSIPSEVLYCRNKEMIKAAKEIASTYSIDLVYIKRLRAFQYSEKIIDVPIIVDTTDAMSLFYKKLSKARAWYKRPFDYIEYRKYLSYEKKVGTSKKCRGLVVCSPVDQAYLEQVTGTKPFLIPNTVESLPEFLPSKKEVAKHSLLISGLMDKFVNVEGVQFFMEKVFPLVREQFPDIHIDIVGPNPTERIKKLANEKINVTGFVHDISPYIKKSHVVVCPIQTGTGTRNKILQAWQYGKPVVSTRAGAEGLTAHHGHNILLTDTPEDFAAMIIKIFRDDHLADVIGKNGYQTVAENYSSQTLTEALDAMISSLR